MDRKIIRIATFVLALSATAMAGPTLTIDAHPRGAWAVAYSPDGTKLATAGPGPLKLWDAAGKELASLGGHSRTYCLAFSPDGKTVALGDWIGAVCLWDLKTNKETARGKGSWHEVLGIGFAPDGKRMVSAGQDGKLRVWDAAKAVELAVLETPILTSGTEAQKQASIRKAQKTPAWSMAFTPDGKTVFSGHDNGMIVPWSLSDRSEGSPLKNHGQVRALRVTPDGKTLISGSTVTKGTPANTPNLLIWDLATRKPRLSLSAHGGAILCGAISPDSKTLATGGKDATVVLWDLATGKPTTTLKAHTKDVQCVAFRPDGKQVASASLDGKVILWDLAPPPAPKPPKPAPKPTPPPPAKQ